MVLMLPVAHPPFCCLSLQSTPQDVPLFCPQLSNLPVQGEVTIVHIAWV